MLSAQRWSSGIYSAHPPLQALDLAEPRGVVPTSLTIVSPGVSPKQPAATNQPRPEQATAADLDHAGKPRERFEAVVDGYLLQGGDDLALLERRPNISSCVQ